MQVVTMTSSGSGSARVWTELVRLPRLIRRLAPHVVLNPNESIPPRLNCGLVVVSQNLFFHCPATPADITDWEQAKRWFNFGTLEIGAEGDLTAEVIDTAGQPRFSLTLEP